LGLTRNLSVSKKGTLFTTSSISRIFSMSFNSHENYYTFYCIPHSSYFFYLLLHLHSLFHYLLFVQLILILTPPYYSLRVQVFFPNLIQFQLIISYCIIKSILVITFNIIFLSISLVLTQLFKLVLILIHVYIFKIMFLICLTIQIVFTWYLNIII
jgi:hypothetical protein